MKRERVKTAQKIETWFGDLDRGHEPVYLVGGAVRDLLLEKEAKDLDFVCKDALVLAQKLARQHGARLIEWKKDDREKVTYRLVRRLREGKPEEIDITPFRGGTLESDLQARDFTINAMALPVEENGIMGDIVDLYDGKRDLLKRCLVRMTNTRTFQADPLRILRGYRFAALLGFYMESDTKTRMEQDKNRLSLVAGERITKELLQILKTSRAAITMRQMDESGVLEVLFPEIGPMKGCTQNSFHSRDVWEHSMQVLENCEWIIEHLDSLFEKHAVEMREYLEQKDRLAWLKLAGLLHDMGKPSTRDVNNENGRITFYGHDKTGATMIDQVASRLRLSRESADFLETLIAEHLHVLNLSSPDIRPGTRTKWFRKFKDVSLAIIILGMADVKGTLGEDYPEEMREAHLRWSVETVDEYLERIKPELERPSLIAGKDLIDLGMKPGPEIGELLKKVQQAQDNGGIGDREEALVFVKGVLKSIGSLVCR